MKATLLTAEALSPSEEKLWQALSTIPDPEMPIVNLVELGIIREIEIRDSRTTITITPTFSACPAYEVMADQILGKALEQGAKNVQVLTRHNPSWTSEWITPEAREKLKSIGITPPPHHSGDFSKLLHDPVECPHCASHKTTLRNSFGSTPCRMIYTCDNCLEPFEMFKPL